MCFIILYNCYYIKSFACFPYILQFPYFTITTRAKRCPLHNAVFLCLLIHRLSIHRLSMYYHIILSNIYTICIFLHPFYPFSLTFRPFPFVYLYYLYIVYIMYIVYIIILHNQQDTTNKTHNEQIKQLHRFIFYHFKTANPSRCFSCFFHLFLFFYNWHIAQRFFIKNTIYNPFIFLFLDFPKNILCIFYKRL